MVGLLSSQEESRSVSSAMIKEPDYECFAKAILDVSAGYTDDLDGCDVFELAKKFHMIKPVIATEPCSEDSCMCAEVGCEFPVECWRRNYDE